MVNNPVAAGPGAIPDQGIAPSPMLEGASQYEAVDVFNPLSVPFRGLVGMTKPTNMPFEVRQDGNTQTITRDENAVRMNYGLNLKNPDHMAKMPITNTIEIPSGKTIRILGNEAQVIVRQLVNEIMQREGNSLKLADPTERHLVEQRVIRGRQSVDSILGHQPVSIQTQINESIAQANGQQNEEEFPGLNQSAQESPERSADSADTAGTRKGGAKDSSERAK